MRRLLSSLVLGLTVVVVLVVIVLTWRPWVDGAQGRITASGLVPVLTLLLGQLGSWVITSASADQVVAVRQTELKHDAEQSAARYDRKIADTEARRAREVVSATRELFLEAIRATSALGPALASARQLMQPAIPAEEFARARVALLAVVPVIDAEGEVAAARAHVMQSMDELYHAGSKTAFRDIAGQILLELTEFDSVLAGSEHMA